MVGGALRWCGTAAFALYVWLALPGVGWMDSGELTAAAWGLGGAHPPGHPAHTLLGKLATLLPVGEVAFRVSLLSAGAMAMAVVGVVALARALVPAQRVAAVAAGVLAAVSPITTMNATRPEVYGPVTALVVWALVSTVWWLRERDARCALGAGGLCAMAAAFHPLIAAAAAAPMALAIGVTARARLRRLAAPTLGLAVMGLATYLYLPARAHAATTPMLMWGEPASLGSLLELMTGAAYRDNFALGNAAERIATLIALLTEGSGLAIVFAGLAGLAFAALTRLRGAAVVLAMAVCVVLGAATQGAFNPDFAGYVLPAQMCLAAGVAVLVAAITRALPPELQTHRAVPAVLLAPLAGLALLGPLARAEREPRNSDAPLRYWEATVGQMPPGPGVFVGVSDHALFPALYERLVAGARPDVGIAGADLVRDVWFLRHLERWLPALHVPHLDDDARDAIAARLVAENLRRGHDVGGQVAAFGALRSSHAAPRGRGWRYALTPVDARAGEHVPAPPDYRGRIGRRVAAQVARERALWEAGRGRLARAAHAAGLTDRFDVPLPEATTRPALYPRLPAVTPVFIAEPWQLDALADELAWRAGLVPDTPPAHAPLERRLLSAWHALLDGRASIEAIAALGRDAMLATARMLFELGRSDDAARVLAAALEADPRDAAALVLLGSLAGNQGRLDDAAALFERAIAAEPDHADAHARLGVAQARRGDLDAARQSWQRALALDPDRMDVASWLRSAAGDGKPGTPPQP